MTIRRFEDLEVWRVARELNRGVYRACESQRLASDYPLMNQMKRASVSITSNIAEGFERGSRKQNIEACFVAKGSAGELRSQVLLAHDAGLLDDPARDWLLERCEQCSRMLAAYVASLQRSQAEFPGVKVAAARARSHEAKGQTKP